MSDESVRLSLRIHDEVWQIHQVCVLPADRNSAMAVTSLGPIFVLADLTSFLASRRQSRRHRMVEAVLSSTSERRVAP